MTTDETLRIAQMAINRRLPSPLPALICDFLRPTIQQRARRVERLLQAAHPRFRYHWYRGNRHVTYTFDPCPAPQKPRHVICRAIELTTSWPGQPGRHHTTHVKIMLPQNHGLFLYRFHHTLKGTEWPFSSTHETLLP